MQLLKQIQNRNPRKRDFGWHLNQPHYFSFSSLVDVRSKPSNILDHFHCLVDCQNNRDPTWSAEKVLVSGHGKVPFEKFGILKSLEIEKVIRIELFGWKKTNIFVNQVDKVTERILHRCEEEGDRALRHDKWRKTQTKERAEQQCRTVRIIDTLNWWLFV